MFIAFNKFSFLMFFFLWSVNFGYEPELEIKIAQTETYRDAANCKISWKIST